MFLYNNTSSNIGLACIIRHFFFFINSCEPGSHELFKKVKHSLRAFRVKHSSVFIYMHAAHDTEFLSLKCSMEIFYKFPTVNISKLNF